MPEEEINRILKPLLSQSLKPACNQAGDDMPTLVPDTRMRT